MASGGTCADSFRCSSTCPTAGECVSQATTRRRPPHRTHVSTSCASGDEIEVPLGSLDAPDQLVPTYEDWTIRRESWWPRFPLARHYERARDSTSRFEG